MSLYSTVSLPEGFEGERCLVGEFEAHGVTLGVQGS
jgi:hypothetical protein